MAILYNVLGTSVKMFFAVHHRPRESVSPVDCEMIGCRFSADSLIAPFVDATIKIPKRLLLSDRDPEFDRYGPLVDCVLQRGGAGGQR